MKIIITEQQLETIKNSGKKMSLSAKFKDFRDGTGNVAKKIWDHIKKFETFIPFTYDDAVYPSKEFTGTTPKGTLTIGYGHTGDEAVKGNKVDESKANQLLNVDVQESADCVKRWQNRQYKNKNRKYKVTQGMYEAMIDMSFNLGCSGFVNGDIITHVEKGEYKEASNKILNGNWGHDKRRAATQKLFCSSGGCV